MWMGVWMGKEQKCRPIDPLYFGVWRKRCQKIYLHSIGSRRKKIVGDRYSNLTSKEKIDKNDWYKKVSIFDLERKKINLIPNKSFRYYNL